MIAWLTGFADMINGLFVVVAAILTVALALLVAAGALWLAWRLVTLQTNRIIRRLADQHTLQRVQEVFARERQTEQTAHLKPDTENAS